MKRIYFVLSRESKNGKFHAMVVSYGEHDNIAHIADDYSTSVWTVVTANTYPRWRCQEIADRWNDEWRRDGRFSL